MKETVGINCLFTVCVADKLLLLLPYCFPDEKVEHSLGDYLMVTLCEVPYL